MGGAVVRPPARSHAAATPTLARLALQVADAGPPHAPVEVVHALALHTLVVVLQEVEVLHVHPELLLGVRGIVLALSCGLVVPRPSIDKLNMFYVIVVLQHTLTHTL